jgi:hypothetical protein
MVYDARGSQNVHQDQVLTDISVAYPQGDLVGEALVPAVRVKKQSDKYGVYGREAWGLDTGGDYRAPGAEANEVSGMQVSTESYFCQEHALQVRVTKEEIENSDSWLDPMADATELVTSRLLLVRELAIKNMVTTAANLTSGNSVTLSGTSQWNDYVNSDPIGVWRTGVRTFHGKLFFEPNLGVIPYQVMSQLMDHPDFIERIKYSERGVLTAEIIASIFNIPRIIVPGVGYNSANLGQTASLGYLWGKDVLMAYVPPRPGRRVPAFAYEFVWPENGSQVQMAERWWEQSRKSWVIRVSRRYDLQFIAQDASDKGLAGYLIKAAVA